MPFLIRKDSLSKPDQEPVYSHLISKRIMIVGLGNPSGQYSQTRHNIGFILIDKIRKKFNCQSLGYKSKFKAEIGEAVENDCRIHLVKPQTFMNHSGLAVSLVANWLKIPTSNIYIIADQVDLNWGTISFKTIKSRSSHNGINSIQDQLQNKSLNIFQIGIGPKQAESQDLSDFVLSKFPKNQIEQIDQVSEYLFELIQEATLGEVSPGKIVCFN